MANAGDSYIVVLEKAHMEWGTLRYNDSRDIIYGEGYIQIPSKVAYGLKLLNSNGTLHIDVLGKNLFNCISADGLYKGILRAQGNQADKRFAKQFSGDKSLKSIGSWYQAVNAQVGDKIKVTWKTPTDIIIEKI